MLAFLTAGLVLATTPNLSLKAPPVEETPLVSAVCSIKTSTTDGFIRSQCSVGAVRQGNTTGVGFILEGGSVMFIGTEAGDGSLAVDAMIVSDSVYQASGTCRTGKRSVICSGAPIGISQPVVIQAEF